MRRPSSRIIALSAILVVLLGALWRLLFLYWTQVETNVQSIKITLGLSIAVLALFAMVWWLPKLQVRRSIGLTVENRFDRENEARKTLAQVLGGLAIIVGLYSTIETLQTGQKSLDVSRQGQIADRFTKAIEQLGTTDTKGSPKLEVRLGGIYALGQIARYSPPDRWPIIQVLSAYVRENSRRKATQVVLPGAPAVSCEHVKADIQAILTVLGGRDHTDKELGETLDLSDAGLCNANLVSAYFYEADLRRIDLAGANLTRANLRRADLTDANLSDSRLELADLHDTILHNAKLGEANFIGADLSRTDLTGADLSKARWLKQEQIDSAHGDSSTRLPEILMRPASWRK